MKKQIDEAHKELEKGEKEMKVFRIEYTKQVRENEDTVKRYRKMIEDEKQFAITKFAKDLLEVRDAMRFALENTDKEAAMKEEDIQALREKFASNLEGQVMTADVMDKVLARFNLEQYDPKGLVFDPKLHEAVFTVNESEFKAGHVAITMSTGWKIGERILRAAKVGIVKK
jgi:molecular chaperone GrpE